MSKLKSNPELASHAASFEGIAPERKKEIVDHLVHLPEEHHAAVRTVLETGGDEHPETRFVRGCFASAKPAPTTAPTAATQPEQQEQSFHESEEHPGFAPAA